MSLTNYKPRATRTKTARSNKYLTDRQVNGVEIAVHELLTFVYSDELQERLAEVDNEREWPFELTLDILWSFLTTAANKGTSDSTEFGTIEITECTLAPVAGHGEEGDDDYFMGFEETTVELNNPLEIDLDTVAACIADYKNVTIRRYCGFYATKVLKHAKDHDIIWDWGASNHLSPNIGAFGFDFWQWLPTKYIPRQVYEALDKAFRYAVNHAPAQTDYYGSDATLGESSKPSE